MMPRISETQLRDLWRAQNGLPESQAKARDEVVLQSETVERVSRLDVRRSTSANVSTGVTAGETAHSFRPGVNYTMGHGEQCRCARCREFWVAYWASRYDAIAPLTKAYINNQPTGIERLRSDNLRAFKPEAA